MPFVKLVDDSGTDTADRVFIFRDDLNAPQSNILRLAHMMRTRALPAGREVTSLTISVCINNFENPFQTMLSLLLPQLSSLKHLTLQSISEIQLPYNNVLLHEQFSLAAFATALSGTSPSLQSLDVDLALHPNYSDGWPIGSLRHFTKLQHLSIHPNFLFGLYWSLIRERLSMDAILPSGLKSLRLRWCTISELVGLETILASFVNDSGSSSRRMEKLVVQLDARAESNYYQKAADVFGGQMERRMERLNTIAKGWGLELRLAME